jgi:DNA-directed RNA polymerase subunit RPC12/RpoP
MESFRYTCTYCGSDTRVTNLNFTEGVTEIRYDYVCQKCLADLHADLYKKNGGAKENT